MSVDGSEVEEVAFGVGRFEVEGSLVPEGSFVEEEVIALAVPVSGDLKGLGVLEVVFDALFWVGSLLVFPVALVEGLAEVCEGAVVEGVWDVVPLAVETEGDAVLGGGDRGVEALSLGACDWIAGGRWLGDGLCAHEKDDSCDEC